MRTKVTAVVVAIAIISAKNIFAQDDKECPEAPPGFQLLNPGFRSVDGHPYCYLNDLYERGTAIAQWNLGVRYDDWGKHAEAQKWFRAAAEQGDAQAQFRVGRNLQDEEEAVKWYRLAAEQGHTGAQYALGYRYRDGRGVRQNYVKAMKLFRLVAEKDSGTGGRAALYTLGAMHDNGEGVPQDYVEARKLYLLAAEQGSIEATLKLSSMYKSSRGVPQDNVLAYMWFSIYAHGVYVEEPNSRGITEKGMTLAEKARGEAMARDWIDSH